MLILCDLKWTLASMSSLVDPSDPDSPYLSFKHLPVLWQMLFPDTMHCPCLENLGLIALNESEQIKVFNVQNLVSLVIFQAFRRFVGRIKEQIIK